MQETRIVMMPSELSIDEAIAVRVMTGKNLRVNTSDWVDIYNLSPTAINEIYKAAVALLGE